MAAHVEMIANSTGVKMLVPAELVDKYLRAGHKLVKNTAGATNKKRKAEK